MSDWSDLRYVSIHLPIIMAILVVFQIKHYLADFPLQQNFMFMMGKFKGGYDWILPLLAHVAVHGVFTFVIAALFIAGDASHMFHGPLDWIWWAYHFTLFKAFKVALVDMAIHFTMDRIKASPKLLGRYKALTKREWGELIDSGATKEELAARWKDNNWFWYSLGIDQMVHHLTHYVLICLMIGYCFT